MLTNNTAELLFERWLDFCDIKVIFLIEDLHGYSALYPETLLESNEFLLLGSLLLHLPSLTTSITQRRIRFTRIDSLLFNWFLWFSIYDFSVSEYHQNQKYQTKKSQNCKSVYEKKNYRERWPITYGPLESIRQRCSIIPQKMSPVAFGVAKLF